MHKQRGFTLIELLVVISIIAILAVLVLTNLSGTRVKARNSAAKSDVTEMGKSVELFKADDTANSGEQVIMPTAAAINADSTATLGDSTSASNQTNGFKSIFAGGSNGNTATGAFYAIKIVKTPGTKHTYTYTARTGGTTAATAAQDRVGICYVVGTNVDTPTGITDGYLYVKNGTAYNGDTVATPTYPSGAALCQ